MTKALTDAIATLEQTEQQLHRALVALRDAARTETTVSIAPPNLKVGHPTPILAKGALGQPAAEARERALLRAIADGTQGTATLRSMVSGEGMTPQQHKIAVQNALSRLRQDGLILRGEGGWALTANGRTAAAAHAAKEAP